ncbi:MAG TPA: hypothetical protein VES67_05080 [Vicinamibacterales bacterium]|nr:hypothetical protein [Vicinamibacterales bacterium]
MRRDDGTEAARRKPPQFISGIYNYCDRWCERCRFQSRCRLYRDMQRMERVAEGTLDRADLAALESDEAFEAEEEAPQVSARERAEFLEFLKHVNVEPPPEEAARIRAAFERRDGQQTSHPLSREAMEYADTARRLIGVLDPLLRDRGDPLALEGLETIGRFALFIAVKTRRAVAGLVPPSEELGDDDEFRQSDANGCAKLVRLVIGESREAWLLLMQLPSVAADGVPGAMIARLEDLDGHLAAAFPHAMAFVRAGFDEEG